jgi:hypothetical protein
MYAMKKPHDHIATTLAIRRLTILSISPDSPELVLPASLSAVSETLHRELAVPLDCAAGARYIVLCG